MILWESTAGLPVQRLKAGVGTIGAVFDLEAMKAQAQSTRHVRKYAVVGAPDWAEAMINFFAPSERMLIQLPPTQAVQPRS